MYHPSSTLHPIIVYLNATEPPSLFQHSESLLCTLLCLVRAILRSTSKFPFSSPYHPIHYHFSETFDYSYNSTLDGKRMAYNRRIQLDEWIERTWHRGRTNLPPRGGFPSRRLHSSPAAASSSSQTSDLVSGHLFAASAILGTGVK